MNRTRYLYHSFPRPCPGEDNIELGLKILGSLTKVGLVLAPEIIKWPPQPLGNGSNREHLTVQQRICFTELSAYELGAHAKKFGPFAIEWDIEQLRRLGIVPVFYVPQPLENIPGASAIGMALVVQLSDAQGTMDILTKLQAASEANQDNIPLNITNDVGNVVQTYNIPAANLRDILTFLNYKCSPFDMMSGILIGVSNLFYPTDNLHRGKLLDYYRQREWRLIGNISMGGQAMSRKPQNEEIKIIRETNPEFWNKKISDGKREFDRHTETLVYPDFEGKHILATARRVIVPQNAKKQTTALLKDAGIDIPVVSRSWAGIVGYFS